MNLTFRNTLSAACFNNLVAQPQHACLKEMVADWVLGGSTWGQTTGDAWPTEPAPYTTDGTRRPQWDQTPGVMLELVISVVLSSVECDESGLPVASEFGWRLRRGGADRYGQPESWETFYVGGFINHGSFEQPSWGSHS